MPFSRLFPPTFLGQKWFQPIGIILKSTKKTSMGALHLGFGMVITEIGIFQTLCLLSINKVKITYSCYNVWFKEFPTEHWQEIFVSLYLYLHQISNVNENLLFFSIIIPTQLIHVSLYFFMLTQTLLI